MEAIKPIFLFADSQLLFWRESEGELFLERARKALETEAPKCAYVGASNGDVLDFYHLFRGAMEGIGLSDTRMIPSEPSREDRDYFKKADVILLAGGDVERGLKVMADNGIGPLVAERYASGALLMGVSAGAVQLGQHGLAEPTDGGKPRVLDGFRLVPFFIDVHDEPEWSRLRLKIDKLDGHVRRLGIPSGGGAILHPDLTVEPVRRPLVEVGWKEGEPHQNLLFPPEPGMPEIIEPTPEAPAAPEPEQILELN